MTIFIEIKDKNGKSYALNPANICFMQDCDGGLIINLACGSNIVANGVKQLDVLAAIAKLQFNLAKEYK